MYIVPGDVVSKKVSRENDCSHPFYLRVKRIYGIDSQELTAEDCFKLNINEEYWELYDGWYYYKGVVEPGYVQVVCLKVENKGTPPLEFYTAVNVNGCIEATNVFGQTIVAIRRLK